MPKQPPQKGYKNPKTPSNHATRPVAPSAPSRPRASLTQRPSPYPTPPSKGGINGTRSTTPPDEILQDAPALPSTETGPERNKRTRSTTPPEETLPDAPVSSTDTGPERKKRVLSTRDVGKRGTPAERSSEQKINQLANKMAKTGISGNGGSKGDPAKAIRTRAKAPMDKVTVGPGADMRKIARQGGIISDTGVDTVNAEWVEVNAGGRAGMGGSRGVRRLNPEDGSEWNCCACRRVNGTGGGGMVNGQNHLCESRGCGHVKCRRCSAAAGCAVM